LETAAIDPGGGNLNETSDDVCGRFGVRAPLWLQRRRRGRELDASSRSKPQSSARLEPVAHPESFTEREPLANPGACTQPESQPRTERIPLAQSESFTQSGADVESDTGAKSSTDTDIKPAAPVAGDDLESSVQPIDSAGSVYDSKSRRDTAKLLGVRSGDPRQSNEYQSAWPLLGPGRPQ